MSGTEEIEENTAVDTFDQPVKKDNLYELIHDMVRNPSSAKRRSNDILRMIDECQANGLKEKLFQEARSAERKGETILHTAVQSFSFKTREEKEVTEKIIRTFPEMISADRSQTDYEGQTPLHMGVCKGNVWLVGTMLKNVSDETGGKFPEENNLVSEDEAVMISDNSTRKKEALMEQRATGKKFKNTVMIGEIPLSIAGLTFNHGMYDLLLREKAKIDGINSSGDNVCHSLIRYAHLYPDKLEDVLEMFKKINEDPASYASSPEAILWRKLRKKIWVMVNGKGMTPLQLSASLGLHQIFIFIMELDAYCSENSTDGLFDIKIYDITEIDAISSLPEETSGVQDADDDTHKQPRTEGKTPKSFPKSVLMMLLDLEPTVAFQFILFPPVRRIIAQKWAAYRTIFYLLWSLHILFMLTLSWYSVERSQQLPNTQVDNETYVYDTSALPVFKISLQNKDTFSIVFSIFSCIVAVMFISQDGIRFCNRKMPWSIHSFQNPYSNGWFRVLFLFFAVSLICDLFSTWSERYENYCLYIAVIFGWFLMVFFLRNFGPFSFFTVLIQKSLIGDMFKFFVILGIELIAFSIAIHMSIQGSDAIRDDEYSNFFRVLFSLLKLMVGLGDTPNVYLTRHPAVCIILLIGFIVMTTLLMINALIAMMGRTCMELVENVGNVKAQLRHRSLQRLSIILFIESILRPGWVRKIGEKTQVYRYNNRCKHRILTKRYLLEMRSLQNDENEEHDEEPSTNTWGLQTVIKALGNRKDNRNERPSSGLSDRVRQIFHREKSKTRAKRTEKQKKHAANNVVIPVQVQQPVSQVFGMNLRPAEVWTDNKYQPVHRELDIYHIRHCSRCQSTDQKLENGFDQSLNETLHR